MNDDMQQQDQTTISQQLNSEPQPTPPQPGQQFRPETPINKPKKSKKKIVLIILLLLVLLGGAAAAYFLYFKKDATAPAPQPQSQQTQEAQQATGPISLVYAQSTTNSADDPFNLNTLTLGDNKTAQSYDLSSFSANILDTAIYNQQIAFVIGGSADKTAPTTVLYSSDAGKSFKAIWKGKDSTSSAGLGDQITSIVFSSDGSSLLVGHLPKNAEKNQITEITLQNDPKTTVLLTIDLPGAFLYGFNKTSGQIIYHEGCYNCSGSGPDKMLTYNTKTKTKSNILESEQTILEASPSKDFTKLLYTEATIEDGLISSDTAVKELNLSSKKTETLYVKPKNDPQILSAGYMTDGKTAYFTTEKSVTKLQPNKQTTLFTTTGQIIKSLYVSNSEVVVQTGNPVNEFKVSSFKVQEKKTNDILSGSDITHRLVGVTYID
jgi:hypothetical protein